MIEVNSKKEAVEWASRCPASENEVIEVRQVQELSDFPPDVKEAVAKETLLGSLAHGHAARAAVLGLRPYGTAAGRL